MSRSSKITVVLLSGAAVVLAAAFLPRPWLRSPIDGESPPVTDERLRELRLRIEREVAAADEAIEAYRTGTDGHLDDLALPAEDVLRGLPGVAWVERLVVPEKVARRIVHIRDLHLVPRDLFALDVRQAAGRPLSDAEIDKLYDQHLLETELVQIEQVTVLRCLTRHHGLRRLRIEGLVEGEAKLFAEKAEALKGLASTTADARVQLREVRSLMRSPHRHDEAAAIERQLVGLIDQHRPYLLEVGAPGRLLMVGEPVAVLPLDDGLLLDAARPVTPDGRVRIDPAKLRRREDAMVRAALDGGPFALVILGGSHDLSPSVLRVAGRDCEYVRVTTGAYREFAGE
jgi:hypothetical protein